MFFDCVCWNVIGDLGLGLGLGLGLRPQSHIHILVVLRNSILFSQGKLG